MPLSEDEVSLGDEEFIMPEDPIEQERFKRRLIAIAKNLKKKQQQLQADQDLLADRWTEVLAAEEYGYERPTKSYPKRMLLPQFDDEALTTKKYTSMMIRVCHSRSRFLSCMYIHDDFMTESR